MIYSPLHNLNADNYRLSRYALLLNISNKNYVYSTISHSLIRISDKLKFALSNNKPLTLNADSQQIVNILKNKRILTTQQEDQNILDNIYTHYLKFKNQKSNLYLTILPTERCNLVCNYCFEKNKQQIDMHNIIQKHVISFIQKYPSETYSITWFGGEPLLRIDIIEKILSNLRAISNKRMINHSLITNATLLNERTFELFKKFPLSNIQITLDGKRETHDSIRCFNNQTGTFDLIKKNIVEFSKRFPKTHISLRINISKSNSEEFIDLYLEMVHLFQMNGISNYNIYPGFLKNFGSNKNDLIFFNNSDKIQFYSILRKNGISYHGIPKKITKGCIANINSSLIIGADGALYKCWEHIGIMRNIIGNINNSDQINIAENCDKDLNLLFNSKECNKCPIMPICNFGCMNDINKNTEVQLHNQFCSLYRINDYELLKSVLKDY